MEEFSKPSRSAMEAELTGLAHPENLSSQPGSSRKLNSQPDSEKLKSGVVDLRRRSGNVEDALPSIKPGKNYLSVQKLSSDLSGASQVKPAR